MRRLNRPMLPNWHKRLQTKLGPEYLALLEATKYVDPNSKGGQEIVSIFEKLDSSCGD